jgi:subtilisin family serine protease
VGGARVIITTPGPNINNQDHQFLIQILHSSGFGGPEEDGVWRLRLKGTQVQKGRVDVWSIDDGGGTAVTFRGASVSDSCKIGSPGCAADAITVASYTTKIAWKDFGNVDRAVGMVKDEISSFSSEGPLRTGGQKPDVAAPGAMIVSVLSKQSKVREGFRINNELRVNAGTSMACPFVSGLVALMLQRDPTLTAKDAKAKLQIACEIPHKEAGAFDPKWGRGLISCSKLEQALSGGA